MTSESWDQAPRWSWSLLNILSLPFPLPLPFSFSKINKRWKQPLTLSMCFAFYIRRRSSGDNHWCVPIVLFTFPEQHSVFSQASAFPFKPYVSWGQGLCFLYGWILSSRWVLVREEIKIYWPAEWSLFHLLACWIPTQIFKIKRHVYIALSPIIRFSPSLIFLHSNSCFSNTFQDPLMLAVMHLKIIKFFTLYTPGVLSLSYSCLFLLLNCRS